MRIRFSSVILGIFGMVMVALSASAQTAAPPANMVPSSFADLSERVQDAVVNISTSQKLPEAARNAPGRRAAPVPMPEFPPGSPFQDFFEEFFNGPNGPGMGGPDMGGPMGPLPRVQSLGSGFIIDGSKGLIVTNNHVIDQADEIKVILHDDTQLDAKVLGRDTETDLAILQVKTPKKLVQVNWGDSDVMRVGDWVLAVGNPFGLGGTVTSGIVSARQRNINAGRYDDFIQTDASINRGNSGGPMFNMRGEVIGINTAIFSPTGGSVGIGFAIPSNLAKPVIDQLLKYGSTRRGWIGVRIQDVTPEIAESLGLDTPRGALVASVTVDGPAVKAGLKQGDIILSFNNKPVKEMRYLPRIVADTEIGQAVPITVWRQGKEVALTITTGQLEKAREKGLLDEEKAIETGDAPTPDETAIKPLALSVAPLSGALRKQFNLSDDVQGVLVTRVERDGDAAQKGLLAGDVILEVNQKTVKNPADVTAALKTATAANKTSVLLLVNSQNNLRFVAVRLTK